MTGLGSEAGIRLMEERCPSSDSHFHPLRSRGELQVPGEIRELFDFAPAGRRARSRGAGSWWWIFAAAQRRSLHRRRSSWKCAVRSTRSGVSEYSGAAAAFAAWREEGRVGARCNGGSRPRLCENARQKLLPGSLTDDDLVRY